MSGKKPKATRKRMISCFAQIVQEHIPGWKIEEIASGEKVKARKFSYSSQVYLLMLSQFLHLFSLNEIVDGSKIYAAERSRVRDAQGDADRCGTRIHARNKTLWASCGKGNRIHQVSCH